MSKLIKIILNILVCLSFVISLTACDLLNVFGIRQGNDDIVPNGYTGGVTNDKHYHYVYETVWLETYDELTNALTLLKSNSSEIPKTPIFNCEKYGIDVKYRISFSRDKSEKLQEGREYFDRRLERITVTWYAFFEELTVEELIYSRWNRYYSASVFFDSERIDIPSDVNDVMISIKEPYPNEDIEYNVFYSEKNQFKILMNSPESYLSEEQLDILEQTIEFIE